MVVLAPFIVFYLPYLSRFVADTSHMDFFGVPTNDYYSGAFSSLPTWLNLFASWLALAAAKVLYLVGLRPSYGTTDSVYVLMRALPGIVFLPGLVQIALSRDRSLQLLIAVFLLPILLGPSQDRYTLPIQPLLFYFGLIFYRNAFNRIIQLRS